ncbi:MULTISPECIES: Gx transporter family protein [Megasphaera]|uniref:Heptaprenyl diphosphate synthase n=2 Tax=Megasphaera hutchinsoni TaxID=1588748 RepID=A0A2J8B9W4_9FIRM|nr:MULTISPECIES: Gx transporter family protein [Megasphaera]EGS36363.1 heptaprenyl diphosphate synthase component I [Megasphaera sp. UPII 135-E]PNH21572.1 heptaprenyl diphosphate synthase [Megasphaera genomosp. type_2]
MNNTFRIILLGIFVAQSLVLYIIEGFIPIPFIAPGAKLGLANLITIIALYSLPRKKDVFFIVLLRIILSAAFAGGINTLLYSIAGGVCSLLSMLLLQKTRLFSLFGISAAGGIFHNVGQVIVAACIVENIHIFLYLPVLSLAGAGTGILLGIIATFTLQHIKKLPLIKRLHTLS